MIKRFIRRVLGLPADAAIRVPREKHGLAREAISPAAAYYEEEELQAAQAREAIASV